MILQDVANKALASKIWSLTLDGKILGFRVKSYNPFLDTFAYYDFDISIVKNTPELLDFFKGKVKSFNTLSLKRSNGMLYTSDEIKGIYTAKELVTKEDTITILKPVVLLYKRGYLDV